jgi:hypothetical protein
MCRELEYQMAPGSQEALTEYMAMRKEMPFFANARTVCGAIDLLPLTLTLTLTPNPNPNPNPSPNPNPNSNPDPNPNPNPDPNQVRNAIDLARMKSAIRIFNEKTAPGSDGMVTAVWVRVQLTLSLTLSLSLSLTPSPNPNP